MFLTTIKETPVVLKIKENFEIVCEKEENKKNKIENHKVLLFVNLLFLFIFFCSYFWKKDSKIQTQKILKIYILQCLFSIFLFFK